MELTPLRFWIMWSTCILSIGTEPWASGAHCHKYNGAMELKIYSQGSQESTLDPVGSMESCKVKE